MPLFDVHVPCTCLNDYKHGIASHSIWIFAQMSSWDGGKVTTLKESALQQLLELSHRNDSTTWSKVGLVASSLYLLGKSYMMSIFC